MKLVGSRLGGNINDGSRITTKLCIEVTCNNTKLLGRIDVGSCRSTGYTGHVGVVVVDAINQKVVVAFALAIYAEATEGGLRLGHAGREQNKRIGITT